MTSRIALAALSSLLCLMLLEVAARALLPRLGFVPFPIAEIRGIMQPDATRGYAYSPRIRRHVVTPDYEIEFETNSLGMRDAELDQVPSSAHRLMAVGDSYTQGHGVELVEAWPKQLQARLPDAYVFNAGVSAYGLREMRATAAHFMPILRPEVVLVGVFVNGYPRIDDPYIVVGDGAGVVQRSMASKVVVADDGYLLPTFNDARLQRLAFAIDRHWRFGSQMMHLLLDHHESTSAREPTRDEIAAQVAPMLDELEGLVRDCESNRTPIVALLINSASELDGSLDPVRTTRNQIVLDSAREHHVCIVDPFPAFQRSHLGVGLRLGSDPHWSPEAHRLAAAEVAATLEASRGMDSPCGKAADAMAHAHRTEGHDASGRREASNVLDSLANGDDSRSNRGMRPRWSSAAKDRT